MYHKHTNKRIHCAVQLYFVLARYTVTDNSISLKLSTLVSVHVCFTRVHVGQHTKYRTRTLLGCLAVGCGALRYGAGAIATRLIATLEKRKRRMEASSSLRKASYPWGYEGDKVESSRARASIILHCWIANFHGAQLSLIDHVLMSGEYKNPFLLRDYREAIRFRSMRNPIGRIFF